MTKRRWWPEEVVADVGGRSRRRGGGRFERERKEITILGNLGIFLHNIQVGIYTSSLAN